MTKLGRFIMSPRVELDRTTMTMTQTSQADFENRCRLDVLGLADSSENDQDGVYEDFKENLVRHRAGWYETNLPWKPNHPVLPTNEKGSGRRLNNLVKRLNINGSYQQYDDRIKGERRSQALLTSSENTETNVFDSLLERYPLRKVPRICAWIQRFIKNSRVKPEARKTGPLESLEVKERDI